MVEILDSLLPVLEGAVWFLLGTVGVGLLAFGAWWMYNNMFRFKYPVIVYDAGVKGGALFMTKGGAYVDRKTKNKLFFLKCDKKAGLDPTTPTFLHLGGKTTGFVIKKSSGAYSWGTLNFVGEEQLELAVTDVDVNAAINQFDRHTIAFGKNLDIMQIAMITLFALTVLAISIVLIYFFKKLDVLAEMALHFENAAKILAPGGTTVIAG
jgi:hypothetical protein